MSDVRGGIDLGGTKIEAVVVDADGKEMETDLLSAHKSAVLELKAVQLFPSTGTSLSPSLSYVFSVS